MLRHALPRAVPVCLALLLSACGHEEPVHTSISPAMVVQPQPSALATQSYPGEVRARFDPQLAFRIGGKVTRRLVDEGERVRPINLWPSWTHKTCACNWMQSAPRSPQGRPT